MYLFVYGTLKSGHRNNFYLEDQDLIGEFETESEYRLFDNGSFPMMIEDRDYGYSICGEIWNVDEDILDELDAHEALYERKIINIKDFEEPVYGYIYLHDIVQEHECYSIWG